MRCGKVGFVSVVMEIERRGRGCDEGGVEGGRREVRESDARCEELREREEGKEISRNVYGLEE